MRRVAAGLLVLATRRVEARRCLTLSEVRQIKHEVRGPTILACAQMFAHGTSLAHPPCPSAGSSVGQGGEGSDACACSWWLVLTVSIIDLLL